MDQLAEYLINKETITGREFMRIYRDVEGLADPAIGADKRRVEENSYWAGNPSDTQSASGVGNSQYNGTQDYAGSSYGGVSYDAGASADHGTSGSAGDPAYGAPSDTGNPVGEAPSDTGAPVYGGASGAGWNTDKTDTEV